MVPGAVAQVRDAVRPRRGLGTFSLRHARDVVERVVQDSKDALGEKTAAGQDTSAPAKS